MFLVFIDISEKRMNKYIRFVLSLVLTITTTTTAHAGILDWINTSKSQTTAAVSDHIGDISLDQVYSANSAETKETPKVTASPESKSTTSLLTLKKATAKKTYRVELSGYSSTPDQTDDSPFITARGTYVRDGIVAANFLPFGTAIRIPSLYGDKVFIVEDRMNKRYWQNVDIWFADRQSAVELGRRSVVIEVL